MIGMVGVIGVVDVVGWSDGWLGMVGMVGVVGWSAGLPSWRRAMYYYSFLCNITVALLDLCVFAVFAWLAWSRVWLGRLVGWLGDDGLLIAFREWRGFAWMACLACLA